MTGENERKERKRTEIVEAAFHLFMQKGYSSTKIIEIAELANIGKGTVYEYFRSKEEILLAIIQKYIRVEFIRLPETVRAGQSFLEKLNAFIDFESEFIEKYGRFAVEVRDLVLDAPDARVSSEIIRSIYEFIRTEHLVAAEIIEFGIAAGKVRTVNRAAAAYLMVGVVSTYAAMKCGISQETAALSALSLDEDDEAKMLSLDLYGDIQKGEFTEKDVISLIMNGISA